ncbi:hypothetical protein ACJ73_07530 [Blastomyces percursus]|uniref:Uncharacterized protein n=1 Tax=Blastomyces percursus TaxID=1658174 RepID=A0A1J9QLN8_9EURO|nr:hypothetical protein ACJ73_07530 [Blastomyces percursus]
MVQFSEETKERISKVIGISRVAIHYEPRPQLLKYMPSDYAFIAVNLRAHKHTNVPRYQAFLAPRINSTNLKKQRY